MSASGLLSTGEHPSDPNCNPDVTIECPYNYIPNIDHVRYFLGNQYTKQIDLRFAKFNLEDGWDFFRWGRQTGGTTNSWTGFHAAWSWLSGPQTAETYETNPGKIQFTSDVIIGHPGFYSDQVRVTCQSTPSVTVAQLEDGTRYSGVMMASSDTIYARVPTEASHHITLAMWGESTQGQDFDLYVRCNQMPTPTSWDYRKISGQNEFIHIAPGDFAPYPDCPVPGTWYIAINSYSGAGWFNVVKARHRADQHHSSLRVGAGFDVATAYPGGAQAFKTTLRNNIRNLWGISEGTQYFSTVAWFNNVPIAMIGDQNHCVPGACGGQDCDVCYQNIAGWSFNSFEIVVRSWQWTDPKILAHEMSHKYLGLGYYPGGNPVSDEYWGNNSDPRCGHSTMASWTTDNNNLCIGDPTNSAIPSDHELDRSPGKPAALGDSSWYQIKLTGRTPGGWMPTKTPDNYSYTAFDFDNEMGYVFPP